MSGGVDPEGGWSAGRPGGVLGASAVLLAVLATVVAATTGMLALTAASLGLVAVIGGLAVADRRLAGVGTFALLAAVVAAGWAGAPSATLLPAAAAALLTRGFTTGALDRRTELVDGRSERAELRHVLTAVLAVGLVAGAAYGLVESLRFGASLLGVTLLFVAAVALGYALRE